jgi:dTDP-4-amino-4,6-dideoxygalactose transaminase
MIPQANPGASYLTHKAEIDAAVQQVLSSGWYILGQEVGQFEREFAAFCGVPYAVGVADGTNALVLLMRALGIGPGDEVITTGHTAVATLCAIELVGATPVLADIDPRYYTLSPEAVAAAITPQTKAIVAVHIYGQTADLGALQAIADEHGLLLLEDCAQAHGAVYQGQTVGSIGVGAAFSFYPTKNLGAFGDGGAIVTKDEGVYKKLLALRQYGWEERYISSLQGYNSRLDELQAAILRVKLAHLGADNFARQTLADLYNWALEEMPLHVPAVRPGCEHVFHLYVIQVEDREKVMAEMKKRGVGTAIHYPQPNHLQPAYAGRLRTVPEGLPALMAATPRILSLPLYPELTREQAEEVVTALKASLAAL